MLVTHSLLETGVLSLLLELTPVAPQTNSTDNDLFLLDVITAFYAAST